MAGTADGLSGEVIAVYRTLPARILGWLMVAGAGVLAALTVWDVGSGQREGILGAVALVLGLAAVAWALFLRPHVVLREDGVLLANIVADTVVPFAAVDEITHQWALELHDTDGQRHSAWAVPAKRERTPHRSVDDFAETTTRRGDGGHTAQSVADQAQRALQRWRLDGGQLAADGRGAAVRTDLAWPAIAVLALAVAVAVLAILL
ncbi:hypothetical protein [Serinicoccus kebangsaanensis]|uniref:hypothetical protein n=1 Tax=Serinicoccus kebangsaanensis TaxID=2602069 RepID=UPI00124E95FA|nr:hypothetical protein [Serinicoccus kebangsaanensis]